MILTVILVLVLVGLWLLRSLWPVKGLAYVDVNALREKSALPQQAKVVDVRDAVFYEQCHFHGAINISLGRLPFVWKKELSPDEPVVILSDSLLQSKRAARMLKSRGFRKIYAVRGEFCA